MNDYVLAPEGNFVSTNELYHWGIKGMKWGVRRYQNKDGSLTAEGRKRLSQYTDREDVSDFTLKKGTKFQRVGRGNEIDDRRRTCVSFGKTDNARYINYYDSLSATHKLELTALDDIKVAKGKALVDTYIEMLGTKTASEIAGIDNATYIRGKETGESKQRRKETLSVFKNAWRDQESFDKSFEIFSQKLMANNSNSGEYFDRLKKKGYSAMYDYNDRDAADNPLIVFDRGGSLKTTKVSELTARDIDNAIAYLEKQGAY